MTIFALLVSHNFVNCFLILKRLAKTAKAQQEMKKRYAYFWGLLGTSIIASLAYSIYGSAFVKVNQEYQWILGLFSPFMRQAFTYLMLAVARKTTGTQEMDSGKFLIMHSVSTKHALFLSAIVGGVATPTSTYCIMGADFAYFMFSLRRILKKYETNPDISGKYL